MSERPRQKCKRDFVLCPLHKRPVLLWRQLPAVSARCCPFLAKIPITEAAVCRRDPKRIGWSVMRCRTFAEPLPVCPWSSGRTRSAAGDGAASGSWSLSRGCGGSAGSRPAWRRRWCCSGRWCHLPAACPSCPPPRASGSPSPSSGLLLGEDENHKNLYFYTYLLLLKQEKIRNDLTEDNQFKIFNISDWEPCRASYLFIVIKSAGPHSKHINDMMSPRSLQSFNHLRDFGDIPDATTRVKQTHRFAFLSLLGYSVDICSFV